MIPMTAAQAIQSVLSSEKSFCKFLSANDAGATGGHQAGILVSKSAAAMLFDRPVSDVSGVLKKTVRIVWQENFETESCFTYYESKRELRITRFGRSFPFLRPEQTGALFVLTRQTDSDYSGYFLDTEREIEEFLSAFCISPTETNRLIDACNVTCEARERLAIQEFIGGLSADFPASELMSAAAHAIEEKVYGHPERVITNPDQMLIRWTSMEYALFRELEQAKYRPLIEKGFSSVEEFVRVANIVLNRRKSRAGKSLEHHLSAIFDGNGLPYASQAVTEGKKRPDFLFPSGEAYHDPDFPAERILSLAAKTTCKDRWRQVLSEADRLKDRPKYLCTLQQGISGAQMDEMQAANVVLVVPKPYIETYPKDRRDRIWTIGKFVEFAKEIGGI